MRVMINQIIFVVEILIVTIEKENTQMKARKARFRYVLATRGPRRDHGSH